MDSGGDGFHLLVKAVQEKLPSHIDQYPSAEKTILTNFVNTLLQINQLSKQNISEKREQINEIINDYLKIYFRGHPLYYHLPFLWFAADYLSNASRILSTAGFHPTDFYTYLSRYIRGDSTTQGFFELVKTHTPLSNQNFETLQYVCNKLNVTLTEAQIKALKLIFSYINRESPRALNQKRIKKEISRSFSDRKFVLDIERFFAYLDTLWEIRISNLAFGLIPCLFHVELSDSTSLFDILDFKDRENTTLNTAIIYNIHNSNSYYGMFLIPEGTLDLLHNCFERQEGFQSFDISLIKETRMSHSLKLYQPKKGWRRITSEEYRQLRLHLSTKNTGLTPPTSFFLTPKFNRKWNIHSDRTPITPAQFIDLYCKVHKIFSFQELESITSEFRFTKKEQRLLQYLFQLGVIHLNFNPIRLYRDFSLDGYWIQVPDGMSQESLFILLDYLPSANIFHTEQSTHIWTRLTPDLFQWMIKNITWKVDPVSIYSQGIIPQKEWFNFIEGKWITPRIFLKKGKGINIIE
ncbi:MAG: hypothetical protein ACFFAE_17985 [Candidatus Hodarchaeota archaeon]